MPPTPVSRPLSVLVTGAAGLIGGELCGRLVARGHAVVALVHRAPDVRRNDGSAVPCAPWAGALPPAGGAVRLAGDVTRPGLGLDPAAAGVLGAGLDVVVNCAAVTGFDLAPALYRTVNVEGVAHAAAFAASAPAQLALLHVSTAYVCGERSGPVAEAPADPGARFANPYEASKAAGEGAAWAAAGPRLAIARPSIVAGARDTGAIGRFDPAYGLIKLAAEGRLSVLPVAAGATLDLAPIDHVCAGLVDMVERFDAAAGRIVHLVSGAPTPVTALAALRADFPELAAPRFAAPDAFDPQVLPPAERRLYARAAALFAGYLSRDPRFDDAGLRALSGRTCPPLGRDYLQRLVAYALARGFIRPRPAGASGPQRTSG